ncbi:AAA family ATPase [Consotaella aegiceratis]|uniref:AAA family ATPase n=1 Tax=Consotaella aegiceratis TaxID=3097961 RepID=UPI002F3FE57D
MSSIAVSAPDEARASASAALPDVVVPQIAIAVFGDDPGLKASAEAALGDRRMQRTRMSIHPGGLGAAIDVYNQAPTPNLIVVESDAEDEALFARLETLAEHCLTSTKVIVVGRRNDVSLYRELLTRGVSDYLVTPVDIAALINSVARLYRSSETLDIGRVCAFFGARGGVGSSTVAHNTAWALANELDADVLLVDMDLPFGTVGLDFNTEAPQGILDVIRDVDRLDGVLLDRLSVSRSDRLNLLTPPLSLDDAYDLEEREFDRLLEVVRSSARLTLLDLPHMWTGWVKRLLSDVDEIVITAAPDLANMRNLKGILEFLGESRPNDDPPKLVLNQIGIPKRPEIKPAAFASAVGIDPAETIRFDAKLFGLAANNGQMIREVSKNSKVAQGFQRLGQSISPAKQKTVSRKRAGGLAAKLLGKR